MTFLLRTLLPPNTTNRSDGVGGEPPGGLARDPFTNHKGVMIDGRFTRVRKNSPRPPDMWPEEYATLSAKEKKELRDKMKENQAKKASGEATLPASPAVVDDPDVPSMPTCPATFVHRQKTPEIDHLHVYNACVARPVGKREIRDTPAAEAALQAEWSKLRQAPRGDGTFGAWDESKVREWRDVAAESRRTGKKAHIGRIFEICVEKGSELPKGHKGRKFKGRVVYQGNNVKDETGSFAIFQDLSSAPAAMSAGKMADAYGLLPGHDTQLADGEQAYIQARLKA